MGGRRLVSLFRTTGFKLAAFLVLLATSVMIGLAMLLGNEAGQFVIRVRDDSYEKSIGITLDLDETPSSLLKADGMTGMADYSAAYFVKLGYNDLDAITATTGNYVNDGASLYAYTFYIVNTTADGSNVGVDVSMTYSNVTKGVDTAVRVMTYAYSSNTSTPEIYQKSDSVDIDYVAEYGYIQQPILFEEEGTSSGTIFTGQHYTIGSTASEGDRVDYMKYSVFFWLEGNDPDCDEDIQGGTIKFALQVAVSM